MQSGVCRLDETRSPGTNMQALAAAGNVGQGNGKSKAAAGGRTACIESWRAERVGAAHAPHVGASAAFVLHGPARVIVAFSSSPRAFCSRVP